MDRKTKIRIWIDITNSPHVNFFANMIEELGREHNIILTARPLANTIQLLELHKFKYHLIGKHYGKNIVRKAVGFIIRIFQLFWFLRDKNIDVAISHSSFYSPIVAKMLGAKSIYLNDNEYAEGNRLAFLFADKIMIPEYMDTKGIQKQGASKRKVIKYPGVKEGIYLWHFMLISSNRAISSGKKKRVFFRPEPWTAQYYKGRRNFVDELLTQLADIYDVSILPRDKAQTDYYKQSKFAKLRVFESAVTLTDILRECDLFIGAGGTMTREAAVIGIPTISVYQDHLLQVDKYLIKNGFMVHNKKPDIFFIKDFIERTQVELKDRQLLMNKGKQAYDLIKKTLLSV